MSRRIFSGRGTTRAEDAQGTPTQSHISASILVNEDKIFIHRIHGGMSPGRNAARADDAQGTPTQSYISPSILVYEESYITKYTSIRGFQDGRPHPGPEAAQIGLVDDLISHNGLIQLFEKVNSTTKL